MTGREYLEQYRHKELLLLRVREEYRKELDTIDSIRSALDNSGVPSGHVSRTVELRAMRLAEKAERLRTAELEALLRELMAKAKAMYRESGQSPRYYNVSGVCDEANGTITLKAAIDPSKIGLEETTSEVVGADALATFKVDGTMRLTSAKEGFYYGLATAGRLEDLAAAVDAVKTGGLTRADGGGVNLSAAKPSSGSVFFKVVVSDRQYD